MAHEVLMPDFEDEKEATRWARVNCRSFAYVTITDVSDVSYTMDTIHIFVFGKEEDANWFKLRWL